MKKMAVKITPMKYCMGIDVSKDTLAVCFSQLDGQQGVTVKGTHTFGNNLRGWKAIQTWLGRFRKQADVPFSIVLEATGVYYEGSAFFLKEQGFTLSVVLPNRSKNYARSLNIKTKTDAVDARVLAQMGLERALPVWQGVSGTLLTLKRLCREQAALQALHTTVANQLHAHVHSHEAEKSIVQRLKEHLRFIEKQLQFIARELKDRCAQDADLQEKVDHVCTIKGIGLQTALTVIAETNGFDLIENKAQVVSYAGYDVVEKSSGTSLRGKTHISKKGNSHIRRALYFPAMTAAQHEPNFKALYQRILEKNPKVKMVGLVAVQRKLLVMIYTLYKKNEAYDPTYESKKAAAAAEKSRQEQGLAYTA